MSTLQKVVLLINAHTSLFAIKLGHCKEHTLFSCVTNIENLKTSKTSLVESRFKTIQIVIANKPYSHGGNPTREH